MALGMPTAGAMDRVALRLANALVRQSSRHGRAGDRRDGSRPAGRGRQRADGAGRPALARPDRSTRRAAQAAGVRSHASFEARPGAEGRHDRGLEHGLSRRCRRLCAAGLHGQPVDLCTRRRRRLPGPQARRRRLPAAGARAGAAGEEQQARRSPSTMAAGRSASCGGRRTTISARAAGAPSSKSDYRVSKEADRMGIRFEGPTIEHVVERAPTSSPTASARAPSRCRAPACRSCCWATGRPWAAIRRSPPWPRSTCRDLAACCRARRCASPPVTVEEAEQLRRDQEARIAACHRRLRSPRGRRAASTSRGSTKRT